MRDREKGYGIATDKNFIAKFRHIAVCVVLDEKIFQYHSSMVVAGHYNEDEDVRRGGDLLQDEGKYLKTWLKEFGRVLQDSLAARPRAQSLKLKWTFNTISHTIGRLKGARERLKSWNTRADCEKSLKGVIHTWWDCYRCWKRLTKMVKDVGPTIEVTVEHLSDIEGLKIKVEHIDDEEGATGRFIDTTKINTGEKGIVSGEFKFVFLEMVSFSCIWK